MKEKFVIALAGRPNSGKSSLFNRFVGKRQSLVWDRPGVTRDLVKGRCVDFPDHQVEIWDLAGWAPEGRSFRNLDPQVLTEIDWIWIVVDGSEPLTPADLEVFHAVRRSGKNFLVILNKSDKRSFEYQSSAIFKHFKPKLVRNLSAETKEHLSSLKDELEEIVLKQIKKIPELSEEEEAYEHLDSKSRKVLILGRPNVGKSSIMNRLAQADISIVEDQPGTTRDLVSHSKSLFGYDWEFKDSAGVRKKSKIYGRSADPVEIFSVEKALQEIEKVDFAIFVIEADPNLKLHSQDRKLLHLVRTSLVPTIIVVNKWDLVKNLVDEAQYRQWLKDQLGDLAFLPILFASAKTGFHLQKIFQILKEMNQRLKKIPTSKLNKWLQKLLMERPPKVAKRGKEVGRIRTPTQYINFTYMVHTNSRPMQFQIFCNAPTLVAQDDKKFIQNRLRSEFGLIGIPTKISFRRKK